MNEDKVKELLEELKDGIDNPRIIVPTFDGSDDEEIENDKLLSPNDCKVLLDYITKLQNNWNELKSRLQERINFFEECDKELILSSYKKEIRTLKVVLDDIQELEQGEDE